MSKEMIVSLTRAAPPSAKRARSVSSLAKRHRCATFAAGHALELMIADVTSGDAKRVWHNAPRDSVFTSLNNMKWAGRSVVFPVNVPKDEWDRWYSVPVTGGAPTLLTTTDGMIEDATSVALSKDLKKRGFTFVGSTILYATMQATGMVNDHTTDCFRHSECRQLA